MALIKCSGNTLTDFFCIHDSFDLSKKARLMVFSYNDSSNMKIDEVNDIKKNNCNSELHVSVGAEL